MKSEIIKYNLSSVQRVSKVVESPAEVKLAARVCVVSASYHAKSNLILIRPVRAERHVFQCFREVPSDMLLAETLSGPETFMGPIILPYLKQTPLQRRVISRHVNGQTCGYITACMMRPYFRLVQKHTRTHTHATTHATTHTARCPCTWGKVAVTVRSIKIYTCYI